MTSKTTFLNTPYGAYRHRDVPSEDEVLTHVGPGTPCGEYLRRFWQPVAHLDELKDLPVRIRILGEDLVVFRDRSGNVGLLELHCSHRATSLEFGQIEERGLRCCYHGWLFDCDGTILETPGEPPNSTLKDRLFHGAYPVHEYKGLVFAFMGPLDRKPPFPMYDAYDVPGINLEVGTKNIKHCNWLQVMDNVVDPVHEVFLHARASIIHFNDAKGRPVTALLDVGEFDVVETPIGLMCFETRRVEQDIWFRNIEYIAPNIGHIPLPAVLPPDYPAGKQEVCYFPRLFKWRVPQDDANTLEFTFVRVPEGQVDEYTSSPGVAIKAEQAGMDRPYEERQRVPADYDAQVGQRTIAIHDLEHLATTDRGVILLRKMLREGIRAVERGEDPKGVIREERIIPTYGNETVRRVPLGATPEEDARLVQKTGMGFAEGYLKTPPALADTLVIV